jgi:hypothetical protein
MSIIIPANSAASGGYEVSNSLRFNTASTDYLTRAASAFGTPTNRKKCTISFWCKRSTLTVQQAVMGVETTPAGGSNEARIVLRGDDTLEFYDYQSGYKFRYITNRVFRDVNAWYNIVLVVDTTHPTGSARVNIYINGVQETSFSSSTDPAQNLDTFINSGNYVQLGRQSTGNSYYGGYLSEYVFIDGSALAPTDFGEFDEDSGIWKPINVSGLTFGTNGFYLEFGNSGALGTDSSGAGNTFTASNLAAIDQTTDTCTNNFCLLNSIDKGYGTINFTEGNTQAAGSGSGWKPARASMGVSSGKWYWEVNMTGSNQMGVSNETIDMDNDNAQDLAGVTVFYNASGGIIRTDGSQVGGTTATFVVSDVAGYALNMDDKKLSIYKNGSIIVTNTALSTSITNFALPFFSVNGGADWKINFGNPSVALNSAVADANGYGAFEYAPPSGYLALCTANLSEELS